LSARLVLAGALLAAACAPRSAAPPAAPAVQPAPAELRCPILMYHRIGDPPAGEPVQRHRLYCSWPRFRSHLDVLRRRGCQALTFQDLAPIFAGARPAPAHPVMLTFDDGTDDHVAVEAELKRRGQRAVFFLVVQRLGTPGRLGLEQARAMAGDGMEIGSHSLSHADLGRVTTAAELHAEIDGSRGELERLTGRPVLAFAYPGGVYDGAISATVTAAGYSYARTTQSGTAVLHGRDFMLPAIHVHEETTAPDLERLLRDGPAGPCPICGV
jgi:peptidoglycan/xylan/chitin deacetylase (PgdA/CDA1 family)